jgi:peptidoglycan-N-acetylglucosamine deacetylase
MRTYLVKTPRMLKSLYSSCIWHFEGTIDNIFLTFDDGPHPEATPFILDTLKKYNAKATFFCIGKNVALYPEIYQRIIDEGHAVGNHTNNHLNGWKTDTADYITNIAEAQHSIASNLFRPPYGRITASQIKAIKMKFPEMKIIMWDILSGDFDTEISPEDCLRNCLKDIEAGSIVVLHDSEKAMPRMMYALPKLLRLMSKKKWIAMPIS